MNNVGTAAIIAGGALATAAASWTIWTQDMEPFDGGKSPKGITAREVGAAAGNVAFVAGWLGTAGLIVGPALIKDPKTRVAGIALSAGIAALAVQGAAKLAYEH